MTVYGSRITFFAGLDVPPYTVYNVTLIWEPFLT
jgi:hypothetical protein